MNTYLICNYTLVYILYNYIFFKLIYYSTCTTITLSVGYNWHTKHWPTFLKIFKMTCKLFLVIRIFLIFGKKFQEIHYHFIQSYLKVSNLIIWLSLNERVKDRSSLTCCVTITSCEFQVPKHLTPITHPRNEQVKNTRHL